jgi:hypothetical protein
MAKYSYNELKVAAAEGCRIGGYRGKNVFSCSKWKYDALKSKDAFYVLYDENNKLVHDGIVYGTISDGGLVDEWEYERQRTWVSPQSQVAVTFEPVSPAKHKAQAQTKTVPATAYSAMVAGVGDSGGVINTEDFFVRLDKEINELLATPFDAGDVPWAQ